MPRYGEQITNYISYANVLRIHHLVAWGGEVIRDGTYNRDNIVACNFRFLKIPSENAGPNLSD